MLIINYSKLQFLYLLFYFDLINANGELNYVVLSAETARVKELRWVAAKS